jgi:hypothetical protein
MFKGVLGAVRGREPQGWLGGGLRPSPECSLDRPIQLPDGSVTVIQVLDEVVRQVPGLVWFVSYQPEAADGDVRFGLICSNGMRVDVDFGR